MDRGCSCHQRHIDTSDDPDIGSTSPQHALRAVSLDGTADTARGDRRQPTWLVVTPTQDMHHHQITGTSMSAPEHGTNICAARQALRTREHGIRPRASTDPSCGDA